MQSRKMNRTSPPLFKVSKMMRIILVGFVLIAFRLFFLAIFAHGQEYEKAQNPKQKIVVSEGKRGLITDRFGLPLATNKITYRLEFLFDNLTSLRPRARKEYVEKLSGFLSEVTGKPTLFFEEMIWGKAAQSPHIPLVLLEDLSEKVYFRLKARQYEWPGMIMAMRPCRFYPLGKGCSHVIGHLGQISEKEYARMQKEKEELESFKKSFYGPSPLPLPKGYLGVEEVFNDLERLQNKNYFYNSWVGKRGVEAFYEKDLRGYNERLIFEADHRGILKSQKICNRICLPGSHVQLSISAKLQVFAEELIRKTEKSRKENFKSRDLHAEVLESPWILGGSILAMDPKTGDIVALASYPGFDPNLFVSKSPQAQPRIRNFVENPAFIMDLWDGLIPFTESPSFFWPSFSDFCKILLHPSSPVFSLLPSIKTKEMARIIWLAQQDPNAIDKQVREDPLTTPFLSENHPEFLIALDLARSVCDWKALSLAPPSSIGELTLLELRTLMQSILWSFQELKKQCEPLFLEQLFEPWQKMHFAGYLKEKRLEEKLLGKKNIPYIVYLEKLRKEHFEAFYSLQKNYLLLDLLGLSASGLFLDEAMRSYLQKELSYSPHFARLQLFAKKNSKEDLLALCKAAFRAGENKEELWGSYPFGKKKVSDLFLLAYPRSGFGFLKSYALQEATVVGSLFKIVTGLAALEREQTPFTLTDLSPKEAGLDASVPLGHFADGKIIPRIYKGGRLPKSQKPLGKIDFEQAMERSSNLYFALLAADVLGSGKELLKSAGDLGFGFPSKIDLPGELAGHLPDRLIDDPSQLYSVAIGQGELLATPLQMGLMLCRIAEGGKLFSPSICRAKKEFIADTEWDLRQDPLYKWSYPIGITFPLFTELLPKEIIKKHTMQHAHLQCDKRIDPKVRQKLLSSLYRVVNGEQGTARAGSIRMLIENPVLRSLYLNIKTQMCGKTATSEIDYRPWINGTGKRILNHILFGAVSFADKAKAPYQHKIFETPELVVVVLLRYGDFGKEAAPLAAQMIQKWREIKNSA